MKAHIWYAGWLLAFALVCGCTGTWGRPFNPDIIGQRYYLCCNMGFSTGLGAADSNYGQYLAGVHRYSAGPVLRAGTPVTVTKVGTHGIEFRTDGSDDIYTLTFSYGRQNLTARDYFQLILREKNPLDTLKTSGQVAEAIDAGQLVPGMTKDEALVARGYPPANQTPDLNRKDWLYYETPGFVDHVVFVGDKIESVTREPAPE